MKKKTVIIISSILALLAIIGITYFVLTKQDSNTLTIIEKQWIQNNKNNMIDFSIQNDIPIFSYDGEGLAYEFLQSLEKYTELGFNVLPNSDSTEYAIKLVNEPSKNDIVIYEDNYAWRSRRRKRNTGKDDCGKVRYSAHFHRRYLPCQY